MTITKPTPTTAEKLATYKLRGRRGTQGVFLFFLLEVCLVVIIASTDFLTGTALTTYWLKIFLLVFLCGGALLSMIRSFAYGHLVTRTKAKLKAEAVRTIENDKPPTLFRAKTADNSRGEAFLS